MKTLKIAASIVFISLSNLAFSQHDHHASAHQKAETQREIKDLGKVDNAVREQIDKALQSYFEVKNALVATDGKLAKQKAKALSQLLKSIESSKLNAEQQQVYAKLSKELAFDAEHISETEDLAHQKDHFADLSKNMFQLVKVFKANASPVYYDYCPMAFNNKGGYWVSEQKEIANPYFGNKMLKCGSVKEAL